MPKINAPTEHSNIDLHGLRIKEKLESLKRHHFGYPYNLDFSFAKFAYLLDHFVNNLGDPYHPSNYRMDGRDFEQKLISRLGELWRMPDSWGYVTSSGTEGNLAGVLYGKLCLGNPVVYYSKDTHYSIPKACRAYSLDSIEISSDPSGEIDYSELFRTLVLNSGRPALIICNISTTFRGAYDSGIEIRNALELAGIPKDHRYVHADAALGGMILPFLKDVPSSHKFSEKLFDSVSVSGHKMPGTPIPCGAILTQEWVNGRLATDIEYLGSKDTTLSGSRSGLAAILLYHAITDRSHREWEEIAESCINRAEYLRNQLTAHGVQATRNSLSNQVWFDKPMESIVKKWQLSCIGEEAKVSIMPNHKIDQIDELIQEIINNR